jgi:regulator of sirC expression with transglutaminase-like and TPR domain
MRKRGNEQMAGGLDIDSAVRDWQDCVVRHVVSADDHTKLAEHALNLARILAYPDLDVKANLASIDEMGAKVAHALKSKGITRPTLTIEQINEYLFSDQKFRPNTDDYYNPLNSYLNVVLERKAGIPITLSIIYMRIAQDAGFPMLPVNFPAHFLLKHVMEGDNGEIIVDPFNGGRIMDDYALKALLERSYPHQNIAMTHAFVEKATSAQVMTRMLNNLKSSYYEAQDMERYEVANEMVLAIDQYNPDAVRDRGVVLLKKGKTEEALDALNAYLEIDPEAEDADDVLDVIRQIRAGTYGKKEEES